MTFRPFDDADYDAVCTFLIELNESDRSYVNWNWARFEWMYEHPEFDKSLRSAIGLWCDGDRVVGTAIYDMYFGEAFCGVLPAYRRIFPDVLRYAYDAQRDDAGLAVAFETGNEAARETAQAQGFLPIDQQETVMRIDLNRPLDAALPDGLSFASLDPVQDAYAIAWLFWRGFDHGEDRAQFEREEPIVPRVRKHFDPQLSVAAVDASGEPVACCCVWYDARTDYAYVEPVCTVPSYRHKGVGRAVVYEALNRAKARGAAQAYVISDQTFYENLGFTTAYRYRFFRKP